MMEGPPVQKKPLIAKAALLHVPEISDLDHRCFPEDPWDLPSWGAEISRPGSELIIAKLPDSQGHYQVVGFLLAWWVLDEMEILKVAVHPDFRRHQIARAMLWQLEMRKSIRTFFLEVREDNIGAILLYERCGYQPYGKRPRYYQDGCTALLYRKIFMDR